MLVAAKITLIFQSSLIFYFLGKNEKIPFLARDIFFILANAGCLFLAGGIFLENSFLIKSGIFILIAQALIDSHFIISRYQKNKSIEKNKETNDIKK